MSGNALRLSFDIPHGQDWLVGTAGPPFADAIVDGVNTLDPGQPVTVDELTNALRR